jgi:hypothetical protein
MQKVTPLECIRNVESFAETDLLPKAPEFFYYGRVDMGSGMFNDIISSGYNTFDWTGYNNQIQQVISGFNSGIAYGLIKSKLDQRIYIGLKKKNYL